MPETPHFNLPFQISVGTFATTEQDEYIDIFNCIQAILRTTQGERLELPEFGIPDLLFLTQPIGEEYVTSIVTDQEPRAEVAITELPDDYDQLVVELHVDVYQGGDDQ